MIPNSRSKNKKLIKGTCYSVSHVQLLTTPWTATLQVSCPSPSPGACSNSWPWVSDAIQPSCPLSSPSPLAFNIFQQQSFLMSWLFPSAVQSTGVSASASVLPMNIQDWFPLGLTDLISLQSKSLSRVFSSITVWKHHNSLVLSPALTSVHFSCMSLNIHEHGSAESQVLN